MSALALLAEFIEALAIRVLQLNSFARAFVLGALDFLSSAFTILG